LIVLLCNVIYIDAAEQLKGVQRMEATANYYKESDSQRVRRTKSTRNENWRGGQDQVLEQQFHRFLPTSCTTAGFATCWASASNGDELDLSAGTLSSWDGIRIGVQLTLQNKYASIACSADEGACVWQGASENCVVYIWDNGGITTLSFIILKNGHATSGGGLYVYNANVVLILVLLVDNHCETNGGAIYVTYRGSSSATLHGCSFAGNTASGSAPDVFNFQETVVIAGCPEGKPIFIHPPPCPH